MYIYIAINLLQKYLIFLYCKQFLFNFLFGSYFFDVHVIIVQN